MTVVDAANAEKAQTITEDEERQRLSIAGKSLAQAIQLAERIERRIDSLRIRSN